MPSYLRSLGRVGRPAGADLVGTCAGDGQVEIFDMLRPPGTNTPSTFVGVDVCSDIMHVLCYVSGNMGDLCEVPFVVFLDKVYSLQLATTVTSARGMGHYSG